MQLCWMLLVAATLVAVAHATPFELESNSRVARASADCGCDYHSGGCSISEAAPSGFKCVCVYKGFWSCSGWAKGCDSGEHCPGGQFSWDACRQGGGDCGGY